MTSTLRTHLRIAAQRFADEIADAIELATGEREKTAEKRSPKRRGTRAPVPAAPVSTNALAKADAILERHGLGRRAG